MYGTDDAKNTIKASFAKNCLLARRLLERGVRFVQLFNGATPWAKASATGTAIARSAINTTFTAQFSTARPRPAQDLKARGLLNETLVMWVTEFGRTPAFQQGAYGRDHNPKGFTVWLAGAGVKVPFSLRRDRRIRLPGGRQSNERLGTLRNGVALVGARLPAPEFRFNGADQR